MTTKYINTRSGKYTAAHCCIVFVFLLTAVLSITIMVSEYSRLLFQVGLFFTGWFTWTFFEYMLHRYLMHKDNKAGVLLDFNHRYHHTHPTEIKITSLHRYSLLIVCIALIATSIILDNYFTILAGFLCGFPVYTVMHYLLHQKIMQPFLKKMIAYHVNHHCKYPDLCFGISVTWWDDLFGTVPHQPLISQRIIDFYFQYQPDTPEVSPNL